MSNSVTNAFAKNRAEELGPDLWGKFIVPLFFHKLALSDVRKPLLFEGGRGCGKTALLRYLSHQTQLSSKRKLSVEDLPRQIGLYLRADTQYLRTYWGDWQTEQQWQTIFEHSLCLMILHEMLSAFQLLASDPDRVAMLPGIHALDLSLLRDFDPGAPITLDAAIQFVDRRQNELAVWLNNPEMVQRPLLLPLKPLLLALIRSARQQVPTIAEIDFFVFVDEYENLRAYQMRQINTLLKHSEPPLIFHVAAKRNGMSTRATVGNEQIQDPADFRKIDIEEYLDPDFDLFAAELFCFRLLRKGVSLKGCPVTEELLCDELAVGKRVEDIEYRKSVKAFVASVLPGLDNEEIAMYVMGDEALRARLRKSIEEALKQGTGPIVADRFLLKGAEQASVCVPALLNQGKAPEVVVSEIETYARGEPSQFNTSEWIHHYFMASLLSLYLPLQRPCIAYAGFDAFLRLSRGNVRHFLELCHMSMQVLGDGRVKVVDRIEPTDQAEAARMASALFVKETQGSGDFGNRLYLVVNTLGQIFRLSQHRLAQSEPERTHFSITDGTPSEKADEIIRECVKWSVLFVTKETKVKDSRFVADEYVLNPIFAPYFGISYNKGRRLELSRQALEDILLGDRSRLDKLVRAYKDQWGIRDSHQQMPLL